MTSKCKTDLVGKRFGRYLVVEFMPDNSKYSVFKCVCDCGVIKNQRSFDLTSGRALSCGCLNREKLKQRATHGQSSAKNKKRTRTYNSWASMMDRCHWGGHKKMYALYGAKGRIVCERWHSFENFYADMGERPINTSLDRIDNNGNYEPSNCRWADRATQALNTSKTVKVVYQNSIRKVKELAHELNLPPKALRGRAARRGNDYVLALKTYGVECSYV